MVSGKVVSKVIAFEVYNLPGNVPPLLFMLDFRFIPVSIAANKMVRKFQTTICAPFSG